MSKRGVYCFDQKQEPKIVAKVTNSLHLGQNLPKLLAYFYHFCSLNLLSTYFDSTFEQLSYYDLLLQLDLSSPLYLFSNSFCLALLRSTISSFSNRPQKTISDPPCFLFLALIYYLFSLECQQISFAILGPFLFPFFSSEMHY